MKKSIRYGLFLVVLTLAAAGVALWFFAKGEDLPAISTRPELDLAPKAPLTVLDEVSSVSAPLAPETDPAPEEAFEWPEGVIPNEVILKFSTRSELEAFQREAARAGLTVEVLPALNLVRVRVRDDRELRRLRDLAGDAEFAFNPEVNVPDVPPMDGIAAQYIPFGDKALAWMGIPIGNREWGKGVRIAVLDTGVADHNAFMQASVRHSTILDDEAAKGGVGSHGTAVASLLVGGGEVQGVAPGAELLSIQVLNGEGAGNGFHLAMGIVEAVNSGARLINLSLGSETDSSVLRDAVRYARERGVVLVAAAGNAGAGKLLYPAAYPGVVAVAAVDANGQHLPFSNRGNNITVAAPGYAIFTAAPDGSFSLSSGTSFATPLVSGVLAYLLQSMSGEQAVQILSDSANDGGPPGPDAFLGNGIVDVERIEWRNEPWLHDIAVADHYLDLSGETPRVLVNVENRGTAPTGNVILEVTAGDQVHRFPVERLGAGEAAAKEIPLDGLFDDASEVDIISRLIAAGIEDVRPVNNSKATTIRLYVEPVE